MQLPGKNILVLAAACLSIIGGVGAYKLAQAARASLESNSGSIIASAGQETPSNNSNKLLSALQEIELAASVDSSYANPFAPSTDDTLTARLSKNFFSSYAEIQSSDSQGGTDDEALVNSALASVDLSKLPKEKYVTSDMHIIAGNTKEELRAYGNSFVTIQNEGLSLIQQNPAAYQNNLNAIGSVYASIAAKLITIPVPVALVAEHLSVVNAFYLSSEDFKLISEQEKDPLKSLLGLRQYKDTVERQRQMYTDIAAYINSNGILFNDTEPGYFWMTFGSNATQTTGTSAQ